MQSRTLVITGAFLAALVAGILARFLLAKTGAPLAVKEHFAQRSVGMPVDFSAPAQPFDGTSPILGSEAKPVPQRPYDKADDTQIQFLATNKTGADCCPSVFSTDTGCLCLTDDQKAMMATRGGNRAQGNLA